MCLLPSDGLGLTAYVVAWADKVQQRSYSTVMYGSVMKCNGELCHCE